MKKELLKFSDKEIIAEVERRKKENEERKVPKILKDPDYPQLIRCIERFIDRMYHSNTRLDAKEEIKIIAETTIEVIIGRGHWDWILNRWV